MKRRITAGVLAACMAVSMTGCGAGSSGGSAESANTQTSQETAAEAEDASETADSAASNGEEITLRFAWWGGDERANATLEVINQFTELNPNIKIEAEYGSSDGYSDKLATQLASGTAADIVQVDPGVFPTFVDSGDYFLDYNEYGFDFSNFEENYLHQRVNGYFDGKQYGIPTGMSGGALVVNKDLADKYGIDFSQPYTFDDLLEWGKKVHEEDPDMYLLCANKEFVTNMVLINLYKQKTGKQMFNEETLQANFTTEELKECLEYVEKFYECNVCPPASYMAAYSSDDLPADPNWISGKYVCAFAFISTINVFTAANPDGNWMVGELPVIENAISDGWNVNCPQVLAVTSTCKHPEAAMKFLDYFYNDDTAAKTLGCVRSVPPTEKAQQICVESGSLDELMMDAATVSSKLNGMTEDKYATSSEVKQMLFDMVESIAYGVTDADKGAEELSEELTSYIATQK